VLAPDDESWPFRGERTFADNVFIKPYARAHLDLTNTSLHREKNQYTATLSSCNKLVYATLLLSVLPCLLVLDMYMRRLCPHVRFDCQLLYGKVYIQEQS
jgi:hypothetical protein